VHIVQARPITKVNFDPSYLHLSDDEKGLLYPCEVLSAGQSFVYTDLSKIDVLFADNILSALNIYIAEFNKRARNAVFVKEAGDNYSHLISFFQNLEIPVVAFPEALNLIDVENIVLCTQRGIVKVGCGDAVKIKGWDNHHVSGDIYLVRPEIPPVLAYSSEDVRLEPTSKLIESLKSRNPDVVRYAFDSLLFRLQKFIQGPLKGASPRLQEKVKTLALQVFQFGINAYNCSVDSRKMEQLLAVKFIETRLKTAFESKYVLDGEGFDQLAGEVKLEKQAIKELEELTLNPQTGEYAIELHKVGEMILTENVRKSWIEFIKNIHEMDIKFSFKILIRLIHHLAKTGSLAYFMNSVFPELLQKRLSTKEILSEMLDIVFNKEGFFSKLEDWKYQVYNCDSNLESTMFDQSLKSSSKTFQLIFCKYCDPIYEMQFQLSEHLSEASPSSLVKFDGNNVVLLKSYLAKMEQFWKIFKNSPNYPNKTEKGHSSFIEKNKLGSPVLFGQNKGVSPACYRDLFRENCYTLINVLRNQMFPLLPQVLSSPIGPLVQSLLQLPIPDPDQQRVLTFVQATIDYPWVQLQLNLPIKDHNSTIDLRYNMSNRKVELQFKMYGKLFYTESSSVSILAYAATDAIKGLNFAKNKTPIYDKVDNLLSFTWSFSIPEDPWDLNLLANNLPQYLMRILYSCKREPKDERYISTISSRHMDKQSIFEMILECYSLSGKRKSLVDFFSILPFDFLNEFILNYRNWILDMRNSFEAVFDLLDPKCISYLKNERKILTDKIIIGMLTCLVDLQLEEVNSKVKECMDRLYSFEELRSLIENECNSFSIAAHTNFITVTLPVLTQFYPALYSHFKPYVINYFYDSINTNKKSNYLCFTYQSLAYHLNQWSTQECFDFFKDLTKHACIDHSIELGKLVPYLMYSGQVDELKKYVAQNNAWYPYWTGIMNLYCGFPDIYASHLPSEEEGKARLEQEILNFPLFARGCEPIYLLKCITFSSGVKFIKPLQQNLTKEGIEKCRNKVENEESFYFTTLPKLYEASPRWLQLYQKELINLTHNSYIRYKVAAMIADLLQLFNPNDRTLCYGILIKNKHRKSFVNVLLSCKDKEMQEQMVAYLIQQNRWDLLWSGAWGHNKFHVVWKNEERNEGVKLLRQRFTPERIDQDWGKKPGWKRKMSCVIMGDPRLKETAIEHIFNDFKGCKKILHHMGYCSEVEDEVKLDFLSHFAKLEDHMIKTYIDSCDLDRVVFLMQMIGLEKESDTVWRRFLPFLKGLTEKFRELPKILSNRTELPEEQVTKMLSDLGWKLTDEEGP
jgi:hypothetical protein